MTAMPGIHSYEESPPPSGDVPWALVLEALFPVHAMGVLIHLGKGPHVQTLAISFFGIILEAFPFMLISALAGRFIEEFVPDRVRLWEGLPKMPRHLRQGMPYLYPGFF